MNVTYWIFKLKINSSKQRYIQTHAFYASLRASLTLFEASAGNIELVSASSDGNTASARHFVHRGTQICAIANTKRKEKRGDGGVGGEHESTRQVGLNCDSDLNEKAT